MTFQRARTEEQREVRRRTILTAAAEMLREMPVSDLSLNELSRRVGLAKSNVLRYFDSREGVLLELLDTELQGWLEELRAGLVEGVGRRGSARRRAEQVAHVLARTLAQRRVLCDLMGAQASVLEHNVTVEVIVRHKRIAHERLQEAADLLREHLPELGDGAEVVGFQGLVLVAALTPYSFPPPAVQAAYAAEPALASLHLELADSLELALRTLLLGAVPRAQG